jgi:hypothetical protein
MNSPRVLRSLCTQPTRCASSYEPPRLWPRPTNRRLHVWQPWLLCRVKPIARPSGGRTKSGGSAVPSGGSLVRADNRHGGYTALLCHAATRVAHAEQRTDASRSPLGNQIFLCNIFAAPLTATAFSLYTRCGPCKVSLYDAQTTLIVEEAVDGMCIIASVDPRRWGPFELESALSQPV